MARKRDLHVVFFDLEKAFNNVLREVLWWTMTKKGVPKKYINIEQGVYREIKMNVRTSKEKTKDFLITISLYQGSTLSPFLFASVLDEIKR